MREKLQRRCGSWERGIEMEERETKWIVLLQIQFLIAGGRLGGRRETVKRKEERKGSGDITSNN